MSTTSTTAPRRTSRSTARSSRTQRWLLYSLAGVGIVFFLIHTLRIHQMFVVSSYSSTLISLDPNWFDASNNSSNHNNISLSASLTTNLEEFLTLASVMISRTPTTAMQAVDDNSAASTFTSTTLESMSRHNRPRIQDILDRNVSFWGPYAAMNPNQSMPVWFRNNQTFDDDNNNENDHNFTQERERKRNNTASSWDVTRNVEHIREFKTTDNQHGDSQQVRQQLQEETSSSSQLSSVNNSSSNKDKDKEPLNIVLFYADDWTMKVLGKLNPHVHTPNIDQMADNGVLFTRNCVTTSICWISRNTLATGVYAAVHRNVKIASNAMFNQTVPWLDTLFPLLKRKHGYYTGLVGKWHAPSPRAFMKDTFDKMQFYYGQHWMTRNGRPRHVTDLNGEDALQFLKTRPKDQLFCLVVSFFATHARDGKDPPYEPMPESAQFYPNNSTAKIPRPQTATDAHFQTLPWFLRSHRCEGRKRWKNRFDTDANYQDKIVNLYRMATEVDAVVGAVVEELKTQGVYNKTLLVFTTDNGNLHGEHGLAEKWFPFEESIRVPLVIQDPRMDPGHRGTRCDEFTLSVDLAPTLLGAAQGHAPAPTFWQGRDIADLYRHPPQDRHAQHSWRQDFFYEWSQGEPLNAEGHVGANLPPVFALVRKDYKYFYWPQAKLEQLFHVQVDPYEERDLKQRQEPAFHGNDTAQTTLEALHLMRARYKFLKTWAQSGMPV